MQEAGHEKRRGKQRAREPDSGFACEHCGAETHQDLVKAAFFGEKGLVAIENIPAWVCQRCGEQFYHEETTRKIEKAMAGQATGAKQELLTPVFSLKEVEALKKQAPPGELDDEGREAIESVFAATEPGMHVTEENRDTADAFPCKYCGSDTYVDVVKSILWTDKGLIAIEDIPARACRDCKEQFYDDETAWKIAELEGRGFPREMAKREILVPVFSFSEI